ncbi:Tat pathway signal sequence [Coleophoma crateriformis]|uniref:Tat pathway signal sequence n=1 Tax=Coleophoma crateriformis TaxID=565419 RepID=A0A3D8SYU4_9HELO|nr:Tat pathway signal sequence [Coleophoma crateriformis]
MYSLQYLPYGLLFAIAAEAQTSSGATVISGTATSVGTSELATPTGDYNSYGTTVTLTTTSSAITTEAIVSEVTSGSSTYNVTLGSTTILGIATTTGNSTASETPSQILLSGGSHTTLSANGSSNATATSTSSSATATNTTPCNNFVEFCSRKYSNITEVSAHNSPFVKAGNAAANQALDVTTQLNDGVRLLQGQMHFVNNVPHFCHTSCDVLDAGPITTYLAKVKTWVDSHPYDVVTILLGNGPYAPVTNYSSYIESTGLVNYAYVPSVIPMGLNDWPTLASMILTGKRVVFFMDYQANQTAVPWIIDEFASMYETPFDPTDRTFPCTAQRPPGVTYESSQNLMLLVNHNLNFDITLLSVSLLVPSTPLLNETNAVSGYGSLGLSAENCTATWGKPPKWLNVDYYNYGVGPNGNGSVFEVAATYNNVTYDRACCGASSTSGANRILDVVGRSALLVAAAIVGAAWMSL